MAAQNIKTIEQFENLAQTEGRFLFIKNSLTCPISRAAFNEFEKFVSANEDVPAYFLHVQESRELSNHIAQTYGIKHETPQALLFEGNRVVWDTSHWNITATSIKKAVLA
ncbi:bacillithiol system redox-active protein YtxJ [Metabacillus sp. RGM 3146]|uniref:bacillithiol system redox-active protein YtxJ n=1 Tax=Metabacillus sp. RGM 3146 TaxID=3401092 RepID=UPI003B9A37C1